MNNQEKSTSLIYVGIQITSQIPHSQKILSIPKVNSFKRWSKEENLFYIRFLKIRGKKYSKWTSRKFCKYEKMSQFIGSKTAGQCRSHHQKILTKFKSVDKIIEAFSLKFGNKNSLKESQYEQNKSKQQSSSEVKSSQIKMIEINDEISIDIEKTSENQFEQSIFNVLF